jgi:hypothetical protein
MSNILKIIFSLIGSLCIFLAGWFSHAWKNRGNTAKEVKKTIVDLNSSKYKETNGVNSNQKYLPLFNRGKLKNSFLYNLHKTKTSDDGNNKSDKIKK